MLAEEGPIGAPEFKEGQSRLLQGESTSQETQQPLTRGPRLGTRNFGVLLANSTALALSFRQPPESQESSEPLGAHGPHLRLGAGGLPCQMSAAADTKRQDLLCRENNHGLPQKGWFLSRSSSQAAAPALRARRRGSQPQKCGPHSQETGEHCPPQDGIVQGGSAIVLCSFSGRHPIERSIGPHARVSATHTATLHRHISDQRARCCTFPENFKSPVSPTPRLGLAPIGVGPMGATPVLRRL